MTKPSDVMITPKWLADIVREFADDAISLDVCTQPDNPLAAKRFFSGNGTPQDDGLIQLWDRHGVNWANPPYSRGQVIRWATKAVREARDGCEIIMLTKDDCRTEWNGVLKSNADARCRIAKGVGFLEPDPEGGYRPLPGASWGSALWYFGHRRRRFERVFSRIGEVTHLLGPQEILEAAQ